jgi:hypothetical protein
MSDQKKIHISIHANVDPCGVDGEKIVAELQAFLGLRYLGMSASELDITISEGTDPKEQAGPVVQQNHARILRETLGRVHKLGPPEVQKYIFNQLAAYAKAIGPYCTCPEKWLNPDTDELICVDCGKRFKR